MDTNLVFMYIGVLIFGLAGLVGLAFFLRKGDVYAAVISFGSAILIVSIFIGAYQAVDATAQEIARQKTLLWKVNPEFVVMENEDGIRGWINSKEILPDPRGYLLGPDGQLIHVD